jgi:chloramphenicol-sensitive protein RarD
LGVFVYHEPFTTADLTTFALIWTGLAIYSTDSIMQVRRERRRNLVK